MTIREVEEQTGLSRSNIRFYEKEGLICPMRNERNGYREYTKEDVEAIKKIAYLRTLGISVDVIRKLIRREAALQDVIRQQEMALDQELYRIGQAKALCSRMAAQKDLTYENLQVEAYTEKLSVYWKLYEKVLRLDAVGFLYMWGGLLTWGILTMVSLILAVCLYPYLPPEIPVQYSHGVAVSMVGKGCIFVYPAACVVVRVVFRMCFRWKMRLADGELNNLVADYLTNCLTFLVLLAQVFSILFVFGLVKHIVPLLAAEVVIFGILLVLGIRKRMGKKPGIDV